MNQQQPTPDPKEATHPGSALNPITVMPFVRKGKTSRKCCMCRVQRPIAAFPFAPDPRCEHCLTPEDKEKLQTLRDSGLGKQCPICKLLKPIEQFPFPKDPRCYGCMPEETRELKRLKQLEKVKHEFARVLDATGGDETNMPELQQFVSTVFREWGGFASFVRDWMYHFGVAKEARPGSPLVLNTFQGIAKLFVAAAKLQHQQDVAEMTDEQLTANRSLAVVELLANTSRSEAQTRLLKQMLLDNGLEPTPETVDAVKTT